MMELASRGFVVEKDIAQISTELIGSLFANVVHCINVLGFIKIWFGWFTIKLGVHESIPLFDPSIVEIINPY
jgi:hypothetical protein